ncbi:Serine/arginine-rich splicing factor like [Actinidia chinensis var. chinensis]|uniref:Serine/arginine-rich splicing factor like n=1 Tax=Actinidia chinensis var. chinensis TaxID=1590841 RepID=A0A2R6QAI5_ACTCC|nr:Serine/arginine-rich splicing factor like [Actinidia chinensis var. chinensis]
MEYERIHKVQTGIISPSKLRMKLVGPHHQKKKDGSNSNSSRTSPTKLEDAEFVKNSLLATNSRDFDEDTSSLEVSSMNLSSNQSDQNSCQPRDFVPRENVKLQQFSKSDSGNSSSVHPVKTLEEENIDYDSNASPSSFEFHRGERSLHNPMSRSLSRPMSSKWNDAEKWIMSRQNGQANCSKKTHLQSQANRLAVTNIVRLAPDSASSDQKLSVKQVDFCQSPAQMGLEKFSFVPSGNELISGQASGADVAIDRCCQSLDLKEVDNTGHPTVRSVSMRDMGTEMTPIPSQEPSRNATPVGATTPLRSPTSSVPSTPRRGAPAPTPNGQITDDESHNAMQNRKKELSEEGLKLKTRKEIVALGVQLGKMNIAAWASKDEKEKNASAVESLNAETLKRIEFEKRAAAWEEAEKTRHTARYKHEEIKIQAWESQQKAKHEAEMKRIEAQVEQMTTHAQANMVKQIAMARKKAEEKRAAAEAIRNRKAEKTAAQANYIRQTGRIPSSPFFCCG